MRQFKITQECMFLNKKTPKIVMRLSVHLSLLYETKSVGDGTDEK